MIALALARYLSTQSLVTLVEGAAGGDAFLEVMPSSPNNAVSIKTTGGNMPIGSDHLGYDEPTISVTVRGSALRATHDRARTIYAKLQNLHDVTLDPGDLAIYLHRCTSLNSEPAYLGLDDQGRYGYVLTFACHVRAVTVNRV